MLWNSVTTVSVRPCNRPESDAEAEESSSENDKVVTEWSNPQWNCEPENAIAPPNKLLRKVTSEWAVS